MSNLIESNEGEHEEEYEIYKDVWMIEHHMNPYYGRVWKMGNKLYTKDGYLRELK
jgi:hypothetical protein